MDWIKWGPSGEDVYHRTYSRTLPDGSRESWPDTVYRVVNGNLGLIDRTRHEDDHEADDLYAYIRDFALLPAGRHLWASGVKGRQYLFNCWVAGWPEDKVSGHFRFAFMRLMEGGGVGANYDSGNLYGYGPPDHEVEVHIVCDEAHPDYAELESAGVLSERYHPGYQGSYLEVEDSREGWADALEDVIEAAWSRRSSVVRVFDVSRVRPKSARLKTFGGSASGPMPLAGMLINVGAIVNELHGDGGPMNPLHAMEIDHEIAQCVVAGGNRRSARMSILPWDDPYLDDFLTCKADPGQHWTTNISVAVDGQFFTALDAAAPKAVHLLEQVAEGMLANGEPGIWNRALSQDGEVNPVEATNPCGEIPLENWEPCNLGHINLAAFAPSYPGEGFDLDGARHAARLMTRFLIRATFADVEDPRSREVLDRNRRIGVGLTGVQSALARMGIRYSDAPSHLRWLHILETLAAAVRDEARRYASRLRIPEPIKVTTIAPTGTVSKLPGVSEGIHPIFSRYFLRRIRFATTDPDQVAQLVDYRAKGYRVQSCRYAANTMVVEIPTEDILIGQVDDLEIDRSIVESADELSLRQMLEFQAAVQHFWADNAVSFTANIDPYQYTVPELVEILKEFLPDLKGTTIFPEVSREQAPYERLSAMEFHTLRLTAEIEGGGPIEVGESLDEECAGGACPVR